MGACIGSDEVAGRRRINAGIQNNATNLHEQDKRTRKLLLLGPGDSGKSTVLKQLVQIYGTKFTDARLNLFTPLLKNNILISFCKLVQMSHRYVEEGHAECKVSKENIDHYEVFYEYVKSTMGSMAPGTSGYKPIAVSQKYFTAAEHLWKDPGIQNVYARRSEYQLIDSLEYLMGRINEIRKENYKPTFEDCLRCRASTTGIIEEKLDVHGERFVVMDVGGQRSERKKWIHCFENVTCLIFVVALSGYNQVVFEDEKENQLQEALKVWKKTANLKYFNNIILFLNKSDLFRERIKEIPLTVVFGDYGGSSEFQECTQFILNKFLDLVRDRNKKDIFFHITCATDTNNVRFTFEAVRDIIFKQNFKDANMMEY